MEFPSELNAAKTKPMGQRPLSGQGYRDNQQRVEPTTTCMPSPQRYIHTKLVGVFLQQSQQSLYKHILAT
jgi:hypothetical protein